MTTLWAPDPGKSVHRIAAVKIAGHHPLCDRPQSSLLMLELFFIDREKGLPVILEESDQGAVRKPPLFQFSGVRLRWYAMAYIFFVLLICWN